MKKSIYLISLTAFWIITHHNIVMSDSLSPEEIMERQTVNGIYIHANVQFLLEIINSATQTEVINKAFEVGSTLNPKEKAKLVNESRQYLDSLLFEQSISIHNRKVRSVYYIFKILADSGSEENEEFVLQFIKPANQWLLNDKTIKYHDELPFKDQQMLDSSIRGYAFNCFASDIDDKRSITKMNLLKIKVSNLCDDDPIKVKFLEGIEILEKIRSGELPRGVP